MRLVALKLTVKTAASSVRSSHSSRRTCRCRFRRYRRLPARAGENNNRAGRYPLRVRGSAAQYTGKRAPHLAGRVAFNTPGYRFLSCKLGVLPDCLAVHVHAVLRKHYSKYSLGDHKGDHKAAVLPRYPALPWPRRGPVVTPRRLVRTSKLSTVRPPTSTRLASGLTVMQVMTGSCAIESSAPANRQQTNEYPHLISKRSVNTRLAGTIYFCDSLPQRGKTREGERRADFTSMPLSC